MPSGLRGRRRELSLADLFQSPAPGLAADQGEDGHADQQRHGADDRGQGDDGIVAGFLRALGHPARLASNQVGDDAAGRDVLTWLRRWDVTLASSITSVVGTRVNLVVCDQAGTRTWFSGLRGIVPELGGIDAHAFAAAPIVYLDCYEVLQTAPRELLAAAQDSGAEIVLNLGGSPPPDWLATAIGNRRVSVIQTNGDEHDPAGTRHTLDALAAACAAGSLWCSRTPDALLPQGPGRSPAARAPAAANHPDPGHRRQQDQKPQPGPQPGSRRRSRPLTHPGRQPAPRELRAERARLEQQLADLDEEIAQAPNAALLEQLPVSMVDLSELPDDISRRLFEALRLEISFDHEHERVVFRITLTGDTIDVVRRIAEAAVMPFRRTGTEDARSGQPATGSRKPIGDRTRWRQSADADGDLPRDGCPVTGAVSPIRVAIHTDQPGCSNAGTEARRPGQGYANHPRTRQQPSARRPGGPGPGQGVTFSGSC